MDSEFSELVRQRRSRLGLSQTRLAQLVGRSASAVRAWERGSSRPNDPLLVSALAAVLGVHEVVLRESLGLADEGQTPAPDALEVLFDAEEEDQAAWEALSAHVTGGSLPEGSEKIAPSRSFGLTGEDRPVVEPSDNRLVGLAGGDAGQPLRTPAEGVPDVPGPEPPAARRPGGLRPAEVAPTPETVAAQALPQVPEPEPPAGVPPALDSAEPAEGPAWPREPVRGDQSGRAGATPAAVGAEPGLPGSGGEGAATQLVASPIRTEPPLAPGEPSYLEDPREMATYWVRTALTVAIGLFLLIVLIWAMGNLGDSLSGVWELFKSSS